MLTITDGWRRAFPGAVVGALAVERASNPASHSALEKARGALRAELETRFAGADRAALAALPTIRAYSDYFARHGKTYHVLLQLDSVALKGRPLPRAGALVEAMFLAELRSQLLTAGHDLRALQAPLRLEATRGTERYTLLNGREQTVKAGDMAISDRQGIVSSVLYGPDARTRIHPTTRDVLYTVYGVPGVAPAAVREHLAEIQRLVLRLSPEALVRLLDVTCA